MRQFHRLAVVTAASALLAVVAFAGAAFAAPATVNLRVEGSTQTLFEGAVTTDAKTLTKDGSGPHPCDGTNGGVNASPGPTMTGAMDDGATAAGFTWDATWDDGYQDFFISRIGPDTNTGAPNYQPYWGYFRNWIATQIGGCQQRVQTGDEVVFAYSSFGDPLLQLSGPARAATGESFQVTVEQHDGNGVKAPAAAASVGGSTTDAGGHATLSLSEPGTHRLKAARSGAIRSNALAVCVYAPGSGDCGTDKASASPTPTTGAPSDSTPTPHPTVRDSTPPEIVVTSLRRNGRYRRGPRVLGGRVNEAGGIAQVFLRLRATERGAVPSAGRCRWFSGKREVFTNRRVPCSKARFFRIGADSDWSYLLPDRLRKGSYVLDVKVLDRSYNAGRMSVPFRVL